jgi:hypothetical protein
LAIAFLAEHQFSLSNETRIFAGFFVVYFINPDIITLARTTPRRRTARKNAIPTPSNTTRTKNRSKCVKMRQNARPLFAPPRQSSCAFGHGANLSQKTPI